MLGDRCVFVTILNSLFLSVVDILIALADCQAVEESARKAMRGRGLFVTIVGGGDGAFAEGATNQLAHAGRTVTKSVRSIFSKFKYTLATVPLTGGVEVLKQLLEEKVKCVVDSEVEIFDLEALRAAVDKVNAHKTKGRLVLVN